MENDDATRNFENEKLKNMGVLFNPKTVALVGASRDPDKLGSHVLKSLTGGEFSGKIFPVNPKGGVMMGLEAHVSLKEIPDLIDLVVIIIPAQWVLGVVKDCIEIGVKGIVMITGGFKEVGDENGAYLQEQIAELANGAGIPIIGPNTFGILNLGIGMNASFSPDFSAAKKGNVAIVSQSGGVTHVIGYMSMRNNVGLGKIMGLGNRCNIDFADALVFLMHDLDTKVIAMYIEGVDDPRQLVDLGPAWYKLELLKGITEVICEDDDIAAILIVIVLGEANKHFIKGISAMLSDLSERKPVVGCFVFPTPEWDKDVAAIEETSAFVSYPSPERAAGALANLCLARKIKAAIE